jgi:RsiW-degrading membrane proteinase PrsW (M82 family)
VNLLIIALAPVLIILIYIYIKDKYEKEPLGLLSRALLAGGIIVIPIILAERWLTYQGFGLTGTNSVAYGAFVVAGFTEEFFKFIALYLLIWKNSEFDEKFDGIVYAVFISLGFAAVENVLYIYQSGIEIGYTRALTAVPAHAIFGITMGYYFSLAKFKPHKRYYYMGMALVIPVLLHGIYDFILMSQTDLYLLFFVVYLFLLWRWGFKKLRDIHFQ